MNLVRTETPKTEEDIRSLIVAHAASISGMEAADKPIRQDWLDLLGKPPPGGYWDLDRPFKCWKDAGGNWQTEGVSTCGLVCLGILRRIGVKLPPLYRPYSNGTCMTTIQQCTGWHHAQGADLPGPGDMLIIGSGLATHVFTIINTDNFPIITSVDGGQPGAGNLQAIKTCTRSWAGAGPSLSGRIVLGWIHAGELEFDDSQPCYAPDNWTST